MDICKLEFTKNSTWALQTASQIAKTIQPVFENPNLAKQSLEFPKKIADILDFINKVRSFGIQFLKFKTISMRDVIKNTPSSPERRSLALRNRIEKIKSRRSLLVLEKGRKTIDGGTSKSESLTLLELPPILVASNLSKETAKLEIVNEILPKDYPKTIEKSFSQGAELNPIMGLGKKSMAMAVSRLSPKRIIKRQELECSELFLDNKIIQKPSSQSPLKHSPLLRKRSHSCKPNSGSKRGKKNIKSVRGLSNSIRNKNEKLVKKLQRHLSFQLGNKGTEEGFRKSCLMLSVKKEEEKSSENSEEYAQKVKEAWMNLRNLLGETANEEKKVFLKLIFFF